MEDINSSYSTVKVKLSIWFPHQ